MFIILILGFCYAAVLLQFQPQITPLARVTHVTPEPKTQHIYEELV